MKLVFVTQELDPSHAALEQTLDATVLVTQHYFQRKHLFTVRLESKVTGLDDSGVHWADTDLVNFVAVDDVKGEILAIPRSQRPCARRMIGRMATQRFERRMPFRDRAALFGYLALEPTRLPARSDHGVDSWPDRSSLVFRQCAHTTLA